MRLSTSRSKQREVFDSQQNNDDTNLNKNNDNSHLTGPTYQNSIEPKPKIFTRKSSLSFSNKKPSEKKIKYVKWAHEGSPLPKRKHAFSQLKPKQDDNMTDRESL